jgi:hypothetical protein
MTSSLRSKTARILDLRLFDQLRRLISRADICAGRQSGVVGHPITRVVPCRLPATLVLNRSDRDAGIVPTSKRLAHPLARD